MPQSSARRTALLCGLLLLAVLAVYAQVTGHSFVAWDDDINVYENPLLNPVTTHSFALVWKGPYLRLYIPLAYTVWSLAAGWLQRGAAPGAPLTPKLFHCVNLFLHLLSSLATFFLLRTLLRAAPGVPPGTKKGPAPTDPALQRDWAAACGALLFALHPLQVEPVAWISGLRDVLSGLGAVCALQQYAAFAVSPGGARRAAHYLLATVALVGALLSKPSAVTLPLMAALLDHVVLRRKTGAIVKSLLLWFVIAAAVGLFTQKAQGATHIRALMPLWSRPLVMLDSLAFYLYKLVWPIALSPDYGRAPDYSLERGYLYYTWLAPAALALLIRARPWRAMGAVCAGLFIAAALPVLGFVPFLHQDLSTVADRYVYLSMLGPALGLAWSLSRPGVARPAWVLAGVVLAALGLRSAAQARIWRDTGTLFTRIVALNPDSGIAHLNLGNYLFQEGKIEEARFHFQETLRLRPGDGLGNNNLGNLLAREGKLDEAMAHFQETLRTGVPDTKADAHNALGVLLSQRGQTREAIAQYVAALQINPNKENTHLNLAYLLAQTGNFAEAESHYRWALSARPFSPNAHKGYALMLALAGRLPEAQEQFALGINAPSGSLNSWAGLGDSLLMQRKYLPAIQCYREILRQNPALAEAHNSLGYALAQEGRPAEALKEYQEAVRLSPANRQAQFNLGMTLLGQGRLDEAIRRMTEAVAAIPDAAEIHHNLAIALLRKGDKAGAISHLQTALKLRPDFESSRKALAEISSR